MGRRVARKASTRMTTTPPLVKAALPAFLQGPVTVLDGFFKLYFRARVGGVAIFT